MRLTTVKTQNLSPQTCKQYKFEFNFLFNKNFRNLVYFLPAKVISIWSHHHKNKQNHEGDSDFVQFCGDGTKLKIPIEIFLPLLCTFVGNVCTMKRYLVLSYLFLIKESWGTQSTTICNRYTKIVFLKSKHFSLWKKMKYWKFFSIPFTISIIQNPK